MYSDLLLLFLTFLVCQSLPFRDVYTNHWALRISGGREEADELAAKYGYNNLGQIGALKDYYHFHHSKVVRRSAFTARGDHTFIRMDPRVDWIQQQVIKKRVKRNAVSDNDFFTFNDPKWSNMWYIHCENTSHQCSSEMNIVGAWRRGFTGKNVVVTILDDGIEKNHPDLAANYDPLASYDINGNDRDPTPRYDPSNENKHGTRCAGEVAAVANNSQCIVGIAYHARIGGVRMLDGDVTDLVEAKSLGVRPNHIDIYSASWGPDDDGKTVDGPGTLTKYAFREAIKKGRKGRGSIFVWASGNGGRAGDHCSCDGYTNSIYTISVSSTTEAGTMPWYLEPCASTLTSTYSSGENYHGKIVTTDLRQRCTEGHTGTSVSAPMLAGIIALALEANPLLTWRDVQHLLVKTSRPVHLKANDWKANAAGHRVSHLYGFGLVNAEALVLGAQTWRNVPPQHVCFETPNNTTRYIHTDQLLNVSTDATACMEQPGHQVQYLEHVVVKVTILHPHRGDLQISLVSPSGTRSQLLVNRQVRDRSNGYFTRISLEKLVFNEYNVLLFKQGKTEEQGVVWLGRGEVLGSESNSRTTLRQHDWSKNGFRNWEFMTVHCWGEKAKGLWTLEIRDSPSQPRIIKSLGKLMEWTLILHGTSEQPYYSGSSFTAIPETPSPEQQGEDEEEDEYDGPCHQGCGEKGCDGPSANHCLNCVHFSLGNLRTGRTCVSLCPLGYYEDKAARRCRRCGHGCERCQGGAPNYCHSCRKGLHLHPTSHTCVLSCPPGHYANDVHRQCERCHDNCRTCWHDFDTCTSCKEGYSLSGATCVRTCADGTFLNPEKKCNSCHQSCSSCKGPGTEDCIQCAPGFLKEESQCVTSCSQGYYTQTTSTGSMMCKMCQEQCLSCRAPGIACSRCKEGYSLLGGICIISNICSNADEVFCEMVRSNRLCEKKPFQQFCCRMCLMG